MIVKQGRFYLRHNTLSEDAPIAIIFKVKRMLNVACFSESYTFHPRGGAAYQLDWIFETNQLFEWMNCFWLFIDKPYIAIFVIVLLIFSSILYQNL